MAYSAKADIQKEISDAELIGLTDDEGLGIINDERITAAIAKADALIDSYIGSVEETPLTTVAPIIKQHSVTIAIYYLYSRRSAIPESRAQNYKDAVKNLQDIADGKAVLPPTTAGDIASGNEVNITNEDRIFTRTKMKGF